MNNKAVQLDQCRDREWPHRLDFVLNAKGEKDGIASKGTSGLEMYAESMPGKKQGLGSIPIIS